MPSCFLAACLLLIVAFACNGVAFGASLNVGLGTSQSITSSASYDAATVSGVLNVSNGAVVDLPGKTTLRDSKEDEGVRGRRREGRETISRTRALRSLRSSSDIGILFRRLGLGIG